jgi:3-oxoadipate enol-lactonase
MDRLFASGTVNAEETGDGPPLWLFHSLLSDRASFDAIVPQLSKSFRVIVPELPGFGKSSATTGSLAGVADRMAEAVRDAAGRDDAIVLGNGYGGFVALQMAIRHPGIATRQAHLEIIRGCAHVPQLQSPRAFLEAIADFLSGPAMRVTASR